MTAPLIQNDASSNVEQQKDHPLYKEASALLVSLAKVLPLELCDDCGDSLRTFLSVSEEFAHSEHELNLASDVRSLMQMLQTLHQMQLLPYREDMNDPADAFLLDVAQSCEQRAIQLDSISKKRHLVIDAMKAIRTHHNYLAKRLELYREYLDNVRQGGSNDAGQDSGVAGKNKKKKSNKPIKVKLSQTELESSGVIVSVDPDVRKAVLKKTSFTFTAGESSVRPQCVAICSTLTLSASAQPGPTSTTSPPTTRRHELQCHPSCWTSSSFWTCKQTIKHN